MAYPFPPDVAQLVREQMASGKFESEDELVHEALQCYVVEQADLEAIEAALADLDSGAPGLPIADAFDAIRRRYGVPAAP